MRNFLMRLIGKIRSFLYGRNGFDDLAKHTFIASMIMFLVYGFWPRGIIKVVLSLIYYLLIGYSWFRILSKNIYKRVEENKKYVGELKMIKTRWNQRKTHRFFRCPKCKTWLRLPKGKGKITITCVKCSNKFDRRT